MAGPLYDFTKSRFAELHVLIHTYQEGAIKRIVNK